MKVLDKIGLVLFSTIILLISFALILTISGWLDLDLVIDSIEYITTESIASKITFGIAVLLILLAVKCIFLNSDTKSTSNLKDGILLENDNGKLLVSKDTIESLTNATVRNFETAQNVMTKVELDNENNVSIYITLFVYPDAVIKDLTISLQKDVKETIKKSLDLDVKDVNVRIKNITIKKEVKEKNKKIRRMSMEQFRDFLVRYRGAIIGGIIAIICLIFKIHEFLIGCLIIIAGILIGNYVQQNKEKVKNKIREIVDKW